jgi:hypothetical protein
MENITGPQSIAQNTNNSIARNFAPGSAPNDWVSTTHVHVNIQIARYVTRAEEDGGITLSGLYQLAKLVGVDQPENTTLKTDLIRAIQKTTNHEPCFRSEFNKRCTEKDCKWRTECRKIIAEWCR